MNCKTKKNIAFSLLVYLLCVFTAVPFINSFSSVETSKGEIVITCPVSQDNNSGEVRELEDLADVEEDEENSFAGICHLGHYTAKNIFQTTYSENPTPFTTGYSVPVFLLYRNLRI
ncbi:MAG: hypothetical protein ACOZCO_05860 [Bacteroidota bacterium]